MNQLLLGVTSGLNRKLYKDEGPLSYQSVQDAVVEVAVRMIHLSTAFVSSQRDFIEAKWKPSNCIHSVRMCVCDAEIGEKLYCI